MTESRKFLLFACLLAALCSTYADGVSVPPDAVPKNETKVVEPTVPTAAATNNATVVTTVAPSAANATIKNATIAPTTPIPTNATNPSQNGTSTNGTQAPVAPTIKPVTPAIPIANITAAPTAVNVTEVPPKANITPCNNVQAPTASPSTSTDHGRYFDGLSFIGGMVLAVGLLGIGRVAFKIYKNRSDSPNYLTL